MSPNFDHFRVMLVFFSAFGLMEATVCADEQDAVRKAFGEFKSALLRGDGKTASNIISASTIKLYEDYRQLALNGKREKVKSLSFVNHFTVLRIRTAVSKDELEKLNGKSMVGYAITKGWIGKNSVTRMEIGTIAISGKTASADPLISGRKTSLRTLFVKENGNWKMDLIPAIKAADLALQTYLKKEKLTEEEFLESMRSSVSGKKITDDI